MSIKKDIVNDDCIKTLVHTFYDRVRKNTRLNYIFNEAANVDWDTHLPKMIDFWSNILFQTRRYQGKPFRQHLPLPIKKNDFDLWYGLWIETIDDLFDGERADYAKEIAAKIASAFLTRMDMEGKFD